MTKEDWYKLAEELILNAKNANKVATKFIVSVLLKLSGWKSYLVARVVSKAIELGWVSGKKEVQKIKDKINLNEKENIDSKPNVDQQKRQESEKKVLEGK